MLPQYRTPLVRQNLESLRHHADWRGLGNIAERDALIIAIETLGKPIDIRSRWNEMGTARE